VTERIALFPLGSPLFPGLALPLNVFEERYRALVKDLMKLPRNTPRRFGVIAIKNGQEVAPTGQDGRAKGAAAGLGDDPLDALYGYGCVAEAAGIAERDSGRFDLVATGVARFRLRSVDASGAYLTGEVEIVPERTGSGARALAPEVARAFATYQQRLAGSRGRGQPAQGLPDDPGELSYLVAAAVVAETPVKQRLLEAEDTASRLKGALRLLRRESAIVEKLPSLPAVELTRQAVSAN
jgi:Lon protease-like protein